MILRASLRRLAYWAFVAVTASAAAQISTVQTVPKATLTAGTAAVAFTPVTPSGGTGSYSFAVSPALPGGLAFNASTGAISGTPALSSLTPPFAGYDDFNTGSGAKWAYSFRLGGATATNGMMDFAGARVEFTKGAGAGSYFLGWDGDGAGTASRTAASYTTSWVAEVTVTNTFVAGAGEFAGIGFEATVGAGSYAAVMLTNGGGALHLRAEQSGGVAVSEISAGTNTTVRLRLAWDAGAKALSCYYSLDGGATFPLLATFGSVAGWSSLETSGFLVELFGNSNAAAAIPAGAMRLDNFRVNPSSPTTHTITVADGAGLTASNTFSLLLNPPALSAGQAIAAKTLFTGASPTTFTPVLATGGIAPHQFALFPALPQGLGFNATTGAVSGSAADAALTPAFAGSDDFNTGSDAKWAYYFRTLGRAANNGLLTFSSTSGRLDFTKAAGEGSYFIGWDGDPATPASRTSASLATDWVAEISVTNTFLAGAGEHAGVGLEAAAAGQFAAIVLVNAGGNLNVTANGTGIAMHSVPIASNTNVRLRLAWNATTQVLTSSYSEDWGWTYQTLHTHRPLAEWAAGSAASGFFFEAFADSNAAAAITEGLVHADDFNVVHASSPAAIHAVTVTDALGNTATNTFKLTVSAPPPAPVIANVAPASPRPGDTVTISGSNLGGVIDVAFGGVPASFTYDAGTDTITATVPGTARSGLLTVTSDGGVSEGFAYTVPLTIVSQPQHSVVTAGQATSLGVSAAGGAPGAYTYQWRRNGSLITGATNQMLYVGSMSPAEVADYDVVVADGTATVASGPAALRLANSNRWQWRNRVPTSNDLSAVAYGNGRYVAVGWSGTILSSTNGTTWETQPQRPPAAFLDIGFGNGTFVIVGTNGNVLTSADGLAWSQTSVGLNVSLWGLVYGHGKWVAAGSGGAIYTSTDGATWTRQTAPVSASINGVASTATGFIAVSSSGHILTSNTEATAWAAVQPAATAGVVLYDVKERNGVFVAAGARKVFTSADGGTWTAVTLPTADAGIDWNEIVATAEGFTVVGGSYPNTSSFPKAYAIFSADGSTWTLRTLPGTPALIGATSGAAGYVSVGALGQINHSADGVTWTAVTTGPALPGDIYGGASGPAGTLFVGYGGRVLRSANHVDGWNLVSSGTTQPLMAAAYAAGKYVIVGGSPMLATSPGSGIILHSATGESFTAVPAGSEPLNAVAYDPYVRKFVAAGDGPSIYVASDPGGAWTPVAKPEATGAIRAAAANGGMYVLVGDNGTILTSTDASFWMSVPAVTDVSLTAVAMGDGRIVAAGFNGNASAYRSVFVTTDNGGFTWQLVSVPFTGSIRSLTYADGRFRAVGGSSSVLTSVDGVNWTADTSQFSGLFRSIVRTPAGYALGGTGGAVATLSAPGVRVDVAQQTLVAGAAAPTFTPVSATGGTPPYAFSVTPALPAGLSFNATTGAISGTPSESAGMAPFAGADDFTVSSTQTWPYYFRTNGELEQNGILALANARLEFSKGAGPGSHFRMWDGDPASPAIHTSASLATGWVADLAVTNTYTAAANEFASVGFEIATAPGQYVAVMLTNAGGALRVRAEHGPTSGTDIPTASGADVKLRLAWNPATQTLTASYRLPANTDYTAIATYNIAAIWPADAGAHGFSFEVFGNSNAAAAIAAGPLLADNFSVTATSPATTIHTVTATDAAGVGATGSFRLAVEPATPVIAGISPTAAGVGATVTISGTNLSAATAVRFNGIDANFTVLSGSQIITSVPAGATSGPVTVVFASGLTLTPTATFTTVAPPIITVAPAATTAISGTPASLHVTATSSVPVTYQWYKGTTPLEGRTSATLTFDTPQLADEGMYRVVVTNSAGSVSSPDAMLTVNTPVVIAVQPQSRAVLAGTSTTLGVSATGKPAPAYQWHKDGSPLTGQTSASLTLSSVTAAQAGSYTVVVSNTVNSVTSAPAVVTLNAAAAIATQPSANATYVAGASLTLSVGATGTPAPTYQWRKGGAPVAGATAANLVFPSLTVANAGTYDVVVANVIDGVTHAETSRAVTFAVQQPPVITRAPVAQTIVAGQSATFTVEVNADPAPTFAWRRNGVAVGTNSSTLTLANVPYGSGGSVTVTVTNAAGSVTSSPVSLTVNPVAPAITSPATATAVRGRSFSYQITAGTTQATYGATGLPAGLTIDSATGSITGIPTVDGTFNVVLTATNVTGSDTRSLTLAVNPPPPIINSAAAATGRVNTAFTYGIQAVNTPTSFGAVGLPAGLSVNTSTGVISGTPTQAGVYNVTLSATNAGGTTTSLFVLTIEPPLNAPVYAGPLQLSGVQGSAFAFTPVFSHAPTSYAASGLPAGLTINAATGALAGTVNETGTWTVRLSATNAGGTTTVSVTLTINPAPTAPVITSASMATATAGSVFNFTLTASGSPTSFSATGLPSTLSLDTATGVISGTPAAPGTFTLHVRASNAVGSGPQAVLVLTIKPAANAPIITSSPVVPGRVGEALAHALTATNSPTSFAVTSGTLPAGLTLNVTSGAISGTPTQVGQFRVWFAAANASQGLGLEVLFSISAADTTPVVTSNGTAAGQVGQPFSHLITATNSPTSFAIASGTLPPGLTLGTNGGITGIPAEATVAPVTVTLTATNAAGATSSPKSLTITIAPPAATPVITSALTASGRVAQAFTHQVTASENATSYVAQNLPGGLSLDPATGRLTGAATQAGTFNVTLRAANAAGLGAPSTLVLAVSPAALAPAITSPAAASGKVGAATAFNYAITATPGPILGYGLTGTLPLGLSFNTSTGVISGRPAEAGIFTVELTATGDAGTSLPQTLVINIAPADNVPVITSPLYAVATAGQAFTYQITAASTPAFPAAPFPAPYLLDAVNLPAGLAVNPSTGVIQGIPSTAGVFTATLVGTNEAGTGPMRDLVILVQPAAAAPVITSLSSASAQVGLPFAYQITATNTPLSFEVLGAPAWMNVNGQTGALSGSPVVPGTFSVQLLARNAAGASNPVTLTLTVAAAPNTPAIVSNRTASGQLGAAFTYQIAATNTPTSFVATGLPAGLSLDAATGAISGTPVASGQFEVTLVARNANGSSQPVTLILSIQPNVTFVIPGN